MDPKLYQEPLYQRLLPTMALKQMYMITAVLVAIINEVDSLP
jgi:hypothetical protein